MKRINEAISEKYQGFTKGQRTLAAYVSEHCDKAAFMSSFELADASGVSQSTVMRFAVALGYAGYGDFQQAMQNELQGRLTTLSGFEKQEEKSADRDAWERVAAT
ncbi:MAG: MurR/RpiR family transcriptional regulator, partial [Clostridia bacterium]|nr:MurR/RpiR family transcriptional regulator [Clostridia bacterium]